MTPQLPAETTLGPVVLTVADLRPLRSPTGATTIGLELQERADGRATLGVPDAPLLVLAEVPGAPPADGYSGLFHVALLVPRARGPRALARARRARRRGADRRLRPRRQRGALPARPRPPRHRDLRRPAARAVGGRGRPAADHGAARRGRAAGRARRPGDGTVRAACPPAPPSATCTCGSPTCPRPSASTATCSASSSWRRWARRRRSSAAGGYHHHIGANTWESRGRPPAPAGLGDAAPRAPSCCRPRPSATRRRAGASGRRADRGRRRRDARARPVGQRLPARRRLTVRPTMAGASRRSSSTPSASPGAPSGCSATWSAPAARCSSMRARMAASSPHATSASTTASLPPPSRSPSASPSQRRFAR